MSGAVVLLKGARTAIAILLVPSDPESTPALLVVAVGMLITVALLPNLHAISP